MQSHREEEVSAPALETAETAEYWEEEADNFLNEGFACEYCEDDGMDPLNDYCIECPYCNGGRW